MTANYQSSLPPLTLSPEEELKHLQSNPDWRQRVMGGDLVAGKEFERLTAEIFRLKQQKAAEDGAKAQAERDNILREMERAKLMSASKA